MRDIKDAGVYAGLHVRTVPGMFDIISGKVAVSQLREVDIEDLLRRKPIETDHDAVRQLVRGATVLVTGAGGSIGSEICRQVANLGARELILLGHGENSLFDIHNELRDARPLVELVPVVADIRDAGRIGRVFDTYRPTVVFHAAAHKHVPLMELNPEEAVTNNVLGTRNVLAAAEATGVERFVFISTDKAVNPINVMGATKLLAEALVHESAAQTGLPFVSVRFGNVLASRGSVVPLFRAQIEKGGPVTVTHPEMTRYFMTIPEAVQLVLQAAALGMGGETFLLDMGEPVKIVDLAKDLVQLSGLEVGKDIDIVFTGLRPGEKLFEELYSSVEEFERTEHEKVFRLRNNAGRTGEVTELDALLTAAASGDALRLRQLLGEVLQPTRLAPDQATGVLFQEPDAAAPARLQGVFVSDHEIQNLVEFWRAQLGGASPYGAPSVPVDIPKSDAPLKQTAMFEDMTPADTSTDPLLSEAIDLVRREGRASVSMLQRRMRIGYTRAARIVDMMEEKGIVGPPEGATQVRQVLDYGPTAPPKDDGA